jgi:CheY-like chemotaxis protein/CRP-like cAMP-binding protein
MKKIILIIEDNKDVLENALELLEIAGYQVLTSRNGKEGLMFAKKHKPDLILCDIMMPELDGYGVLRALDNIPEIIGTPFVFMSAKAEQTDFRKGMDLGADDYLTKPFNGDDLLRVISSRFKKNEDLKKVLENSLKGENDFINVSQIEDDLEIISDKRIVKKIRKKDMLFMEGDSANFSFYVISGKIKTFKTNEWGKEYILDIHKKGDFLAYTPIIEDTDHKNSAIAIENSELAVIPKQDFLNLIYSNKEVSKKIIRLLSNNCSEAEEKLLKLAYDSARKRVAEAIIFVSKKYQNEGKDELMFNLLREDISGLSGISPESVSRNITAFKDEGLIESINGVIKIKDLKKLETIKN